MNSARIVFLSAVSVLISQHALGSTSVYELTLKGKACDETSRQSIECNYRVGRSFHVSIAGIGQPDAGIIFMKSDFDGDFYAKVGTGHGCVIVGRGKQHAASDSTVGFAFISPKNGKVYANWQDCKAGR